MVVYDADSLLNADMFTSDGERVGPIEQVFEDSRTGAAQWVAVGTNWLGGNTTLVPLGNVEVAADGTITVPFSKETLSDAPNHDPDDELTPDEQREYFEYYGIDYGHRPEKKVEVEEVRLRRYGGPAYPRDREVVVEEESKKA